jgi:hypothetical protein
MASSVNRTNSLEDERFLSLEDTILHILSLDTWVVAKKLRVSGNLREDAMITETLPVSA